jgi:hypothetical protein
MGREGKEASGKEERLQNCGQGKGSRKKEEDSRHPLGIILLWS